MNEPLPPQTGDSAWMAMIDERLAAGDERMQKIEQSLKEAAQVTGKIEDDLHRNTQATTEVLDILAAAKGAFRFFGAVGSVARWTGGIAAALLAVWGLVIAALGGNTPGGH